MSSKGYASLVRSRGAGYALAGLVLVLVVGCSDSAEERLPPVPDSATSGAAIEPVGPVETVAEALPSEGGTTTTLNRESSEQAATSADPTTPEDIESGIDAAVAPHDPAAVDVVRGPRTDSEEGESPDAVDQPEPDIDPGTSQLQVDDPQPITGGLLSGLYRPDIRIRFGDGESSAMVAGAIGPPGRQVYIVEAAAGQLLTASLDSEPGVWLDLRLGGTVILSQAEEAHWVATSLPSDGRWRVSVVSPDGEPAYYALTLRVVTPESVPVPPTASVPVRRSIEPGNVVYLTFDDGPHPVYTPLMLDALARHGARATFFVLGSLVERHPDLFQRIVSEGHTVANHSWNHENLARLSRGAFDDTISRTQTILGDHATPCLRPPYAATGPHTREWAADHGLEVYLWTVSANDWLGLDATAIANRIVGEVTDRSVVLMHDGGGNRSQTVQGLEIILERLSGRGLRFEPLC